VTGLADHLDAGEWEPAAAAARALAAGTGPVPAGDAWRAAMVLSLHGELAAAGSVLARGADGDPADTAQVAAWEASIRWRTGELAAGHAAAARALADAERSGAPRPLAAAHTALALLAAAEGDRRANDRHYALALAAATAAGDDTQRLRVRANRGSQRLEEGDLAGALAELDAALAEAGPTASPVLLGLARHNRAAALLRSGRLRPAREEFQRSCTLLQRCGSSVVAHPLAGLAETRELAGDLVQARAAYEEAVLVARAAGDVQVLVPALAGLARVLAVLEPAAAGPVAAEAVDRSGGLTDVTARAAAGWAALGRHDPAAARAHAEAAIALAGTRRDRSGLAEGLELAALAAAGGARDPDAARGSAPTALLADAARVLDDIGDPVGGARVELARARAALDPAAAVAAEHRLRELGVDPAVGTRSLMATAGAPIAVRVLGSFAVLRDGRPVPPTGWQSRKARDLLKLLVARRGRPASREALAEALWPGQDGAGGRLSGALSVLRAVLDPDHRLPSDHYVVADSDGIGYDRHALPVDVEAFLRLADAATAAARTGPADRARVLLEAAVAAYTGDVLDGEPDFEPVGPLRDEARAAYLALTRALGRLCAAAGDVDGAVRAWLRLLERDPYDEDGALRLVELLVAAGRPGEAARHHRTYAARMAELGLPAVPAPTRSRPEGHPKVGA
jgi:DNA-binding SARP family transcriptional activator